MEQHATLAWREPDGRADAVVLHPDAALPAPGHRQGAGACRPRACAIVACPNGGGFGGKSDPFNHEIVVAKLALLTGRPVKIALTREEVFYCHRGRHPVLMRVRTGFTKRRRDHRHALPEPARRRRLRLLRRRQHLLHGRAADGDLPACPPTASTACAPSRTSRPAVPSAATARPSRASPSRCTSTRPRRPWASIPPRCASARSCPPDSVTANWLKVGSMGLGAVHREGRGGQRLEGEVREAARAARAWASRAPATSPARGCPSTGTRCPTPASRLKSTAAAAWPSSAARPRSDRAPTRCSPRAWPRCSASD